MGLFGKGNEGKAVVHIEGMSCGHCVMRIEKGVAAMPGVRSAKVDLGKKEGTFEFDPAFTSVEAITAKINEIGYKA
jgi:copper ion binding protein